MVIMALGDKHGDCRIIMVSDDHHCNRDNHGNTGMCLVIGIITGHTKGVIKGYSDKKGVIHRDKQGRGAGINR
jgi:hypothetical protein